MERSHRLKDDLAWLPPGVRRSRRLVTGMIWGGTSAAILGAAMVSPILVGVMWKGFAAGAAGAAVAGERIGHQVLRRKLRAIAAGEIELASLDRRPEGELVAVEGTIQADQTLRGVLTDAEGVYRRLVFTAGGKRVYEAAVDFALVDDSGARILVQAAGARWITPARELVTYPRARFARPEVPEKLRQLVGAYPEIEAFEHVLAVGTRVQVVGYKTASADVTGTMVDYRLPPQRATLQSGPDLPLVISAARDLAP